jgi:hypothetical protein
MSLDLVENISNLVWPVARQLIKKPKRCRICITSSIVEKIDVDGLCESCKNWTPTKECCPHTEQDLSELIQNTEKAIVLVSGGKDSAYILERISNKYPKIKILGLTVDNGFMATNALKNAKNVCDKLNVDWICLQSKKTLFKDNIRNAFLSLNGKGCYSVVDFADGETIFSVAQELSKTLGINTIFGGLTLSQLQEIMGISNFYTNIEGFLTIHPLAVWQTSEAQIKKRVVDLKLIPSGQESATQSNSSLIPVMCWADIKNLGYSSFEPEFSRSIRAGRAKREDWLYVFETLSFAIKQGLLDKQVKQTLSQLDLTMDQIIHE